MGLLLFSYRWTDVWQWMARSLTAHLHANPSLILIGLARLQRVKSTKCEDHLLINGSWFKLDSMYFNNPRQGNYLRFHTQKLKHVGNREDVLQISDFFFLLSFQSSKLVEGIPNTQWYVAKHWCSVLIIWDKDPKATLLPPSLSGESSPLWTWKDRCEVRPLQEWILQNVQLL